MCRERFPGDWPTLEMMRQFISNHRKHEKKKNKKRTASNGGQDADPETDADGLGHDMDLLRNVEDNDLENDGDEDGSN